VRSLSIRIALAALMPAASVSAPVTAQPVAAPVSEHVILISVDGLRPDAIAAAGAHHMARLQAEGAWSHTAQTVLPSKTLPSHTSMVTGVEPAIHGITWNGDRTDETGAVGVATIFELAHQRGLTTAGFFAKSKFNHLDKPGTMDHFQAPHGKDTWPATRTVGDVVNYLHHVRPNLLMVHIGEPDFAGHSLGWGSFIYEWGVRRADGAVGRILEAADAAFGPAGYTVIVTADHGGRGRSHGSDHAEDTTIPWIAWGRGVQAGALSGGIRTTDTAATLLWLLGIAPPTAWTGNVVRAAYTPAAQLAADRAAALPVTAAGGGF
jgi:predicted AlkP superfamily pyrophosphatase or phosphodiesterase